jgi:CRP-like cAMP-binding protein
VRFGGAWRLALRNRDGRLLVAAFAAVTVAEWMTAASFAVHLFEVGGEAAVGLLAVFFLPTAIAGLGAGTLSERRPPERVLAATALTRAAVVGAAAGALAAGWPIGVVAAIVAVDAAVSAAYRPAQAAVLPFLTRSPAELSNTAGLLSTTRTVSQAAGIVLGGLLIAAISVAEVFAGAAALFAIALLLTAALDVRTEVIARRSLGRSAPATDGGKGVLAAARSGLRAFAEIARHRGSRVVIALAGVRAAVRGAWLGLAVLAAAGFLGMGRAGLGELAAAAGIGAVISAPAGSRLVGSPRLATALGASLALTGAALVGVAALATPTAALILLGLWGLGMGLADLAATAVLPRIADARRFGQMTAVTESLKQTAEGVGSLLVPLAAITLGTRGALAVIGAIPPLVALASWRTLTQVDAAAGRRIERIDTIRSAPLLAGLRVVELEAVASAAQPRRLAAGKDVIREGDPDASTFFVIGAGAADVLVEGRLLRTLGPGESFGEIALLHGIQRTATVRARSGLELLALERSDFIRAVTGGEQSGLVRRRPTSTSDLTRRPLREALRAVPWIARLDDEVVERLAAGAGRRSAAAGEILWTQGAAGDTMVIVLAGELAATQGGEVRATIGPGGWAGEVALIHQVPRTATIEARSDVVLCALRRDQFREALAMDDEQVAQLIELFA